jgi:aryl-alcohol dehydrogenase-like predicted oxidoreductase
LGGAFIDNVSFDTGIATVRRALELDIGYIDTSPGYCEGRS